MPALGRARPRESVKKRTRSGRRRPRTGSNNQKTTRRSRRRCGTGPRASAPPVSRPCRGGRRSPRRSWRCRGSAAAAAASGAARPRCRRARRRRRVAAPTPAAGWRDPGPRAACAASPAAARRAPARPGPRRSGRSASSRLVDRTGTIRSPSSSRRRYGAIENNCDTGHPGQRRTGLAVDVGYGRRIRSVLARRTPPRRGTPRSRGRQNGERSWRGCWWALSRQGDRYSVRSG